MISSPITHPDFPPYPPISFPLYHSDFPQFDKIPGETFSVFSPTESGSYNRRRIFNQMAVQCSQSRSLARFKGITHHFEFEYLKAKHIPVDEFITSPVFTVGGYDWVIDFHPHGSDTDEEERDGSHVSLYLALVSEAKEVHAKYSFSILDKTGRFVPFDEPILYTFTSHVVDCDIWGYTKFMSKDEIEAHYCKDGLLIISCNLIVLSAPNGVNDSSGDLYEDIERFWDSRECFDVMFEVEGEKISAHRFILAARSPVFKAGLIGPMAEANTSCIKINNMKAEVFKALLHFIYTDDLDFEHRDNKTLPVELVQDLYVAADRYDLQLLKAQCEQRFWVSLSVDTVMTTLLFAEQRNSAWLKEKCLEFASKSENFTHLALTKGYVHMMQSFPSLLPELRQKIKSLSEPANKAAKKQKCAGRYKKQQ